MSKGIRRSLALMLALGASALHAEPLPTAVLTCRPDRIATIGPRLQSEPGQTVQEPGTRVGFANGGGQVSYDVVAAIAKASRIGDHLLICLVFIPKHCPPGDDRGRIYTTTNLRTLESWTLPDSQHSCGGA